MARVYYLGGLHPEGVPGPHYVTAYNTAYALPPVGEPLLVSDHVARKLLKRNGTYIPGAKAPGIHFTMDASLAKRVKRGDSTPYDPYTAKQGNRELTKEELLAKLREIEAAEAKESTTDVQEEPLVKVPKSEIDTIIDADSADIFSVGRKNRKG